MSYQATLKRGFAIVRNQEGKVLRSAKAVAAAPQVGLTLADGEVALTPSGAPISSGKSNPIKTAKPAPKKGSADQGNLF